MSQLRKIAVIGATGTIGKLILSSLVSAQSFQITVLPRLADTASTFPPSVTVRRTDFDSPEDLKKAFQGHEAVVSAVGYTAFEKQRHFIDAAVEAGVQRFIPSEFSVSSQDDAVFNLVPQFEPKKHIISYLQAREKDGLSWTGLATSFLLDQVQGLKNGFLGFDLANKTAVVWDGGDKPVSFATEKELGDAVVSVLLKPDETRNKYLYTTSVIASQNEIVRALEKQTGVAWSVQNVSTDAELAKVHQQISAGDYSGAGTLAVAILFSAGKGADMDFASKEGFSNGLLGVKLQDIDSAVKDVLSFSPYK